MNVRVFLFVIERYVGYGNPREFEFLPPEARIRS